MKKTKRLALFISLVIIFTSITVPMDVSAATTSVQSITLNVKPKIGSSASVSILTFQKLSIGV